MGEVEVSGTPDETGALGEPSLPALTPSREDPEESLCRELAQVGRDPALVAQIARLVRLSRELRSRGYTGQVTLHVGNGLVNSVRRE